MSSITRWPCGTLQRRCQFFCQLLPYKISMSLDSSANSPEDVSEGTKAIATQHRSHYRGEWEHFCLGSWCRLLAVSFWEVVSRYFFHKPTEWSYDLTYMLYGTLFMLGGGLHLASRRAYIEPIFYGDNFTVMKQKVGLIHSHMSLFFSSTYLLVLGRHGGVYPRLLPVGTI
jgi:hypothetical protein